jgi:U3 small nucleolar ribonucleoprotein component
MELEKKLAQENNVEKVLAENVEKFQKNVQVLDAEIKRYRDSRHNLHTVIDPLKV